MKLKRELLIEPSHTMPARAGTIVEVDDDRARQWLAAGLAEVSAAGAAAVVAKEPATPKSGKGK